MSDLLALLFSNPYTAVAMLILGFGFLIFIHELGHFLVAKLVGIRATQFAIGFGQALLAYRKGIGLRVGSTEPEYRRRAATRLSAQGIDINKATEKQFYEAADALNLGETEYRLNWAPFGGYVKMLGQEDMDPNARSDDPRAFNRKGFRARAAVISAGVVMNLLLGVALLMLAFADFAGVQFPSPVIGGTFPNSPAATATPLGQNDPNADEAGLKIGDRIIAIDGKPVYDMSEVNIGIALASPDQPMLLTVERPGIELPIEFRVTPEPRPELNGLLGIGITPTNSLTVAAEWFGWHREPQVDPQAPAGQAGVTDGMTLIELDGQPVTEFRQYVQAMKRSDGQPLSAVFVSPDGDRRIETTLIATPGMQASEDAQHLLGLMPAVRVRPTGEDIPAKQAGMQTGDILAELDGQPWPTLNRVSKLVGAAPGKIAITVLRDGQRVDLEPVHPTRRGKLGIAILPANDLPVIAGVLTDSLLADKQIPPGSRLVSINDTPITGWRDAQRELARAAATQCEQASIELTIALPLPGEPIERHKLNLAGETKAELAALTDHWLPDTSVIFDLAEVRIAGETPLAAAKLGIDKSVEFIQKTYVTLLRLFQNTIGLDDLRGPVGIVSDGARFSREGWPYYIFFLGLISINLAVINFLPLPIVDGGLMVFLIIEKLRGKPASPTIQAVTTVIGLMLIAGLFLTVTFYDIVREFIK